MAKKKKKKKEAEVIHHREFTRRQLSARQRQKRRQRIILGSGIIAILAIALIVFFGWYNGEYRALHKTALRVNDTEFDVQYLIDTLITLDMGGASQEEIVNNLYDIVQEIENNELIRQAAEGLGYQVHDREAIELLEYGEVAVNEANIDMAKQDILRQRLFDEYFLPQIPEYDRQVNIMAMLLESESQANEVRDRLLSGSDNFSALADEFSLDYYTSVTNGEVGWHIQRIFGTLLATSVPVDYAFGEDATLGLSQPIFDEEVTKSLGYWLIRVTERDEATWDIHAQALLLNSEEEAWAIRARLEAGEDLAALAEEYSDYDASRDQGGELGLLSEDDISDAFDGYAFSEETEVGVWSQPIPDESKVSKGGYWLVDILGMEDNREVDPDERDYLASNDLQGWMDSLRTDPANVIDETYLSNEDVEWLIERVSKAG